MAIVVQGMGEEARTYCWSMDSVAAEQREQDSSGRLKALVASFAWRSEFSKCNHLCPAEEKARDFWKEFYTKTRWQKLLRGVIAWALKNFNF